MSRGAFVRLSARALLIVTAAGCVQALGLTSDASALSDFCRCSQLQVASDQCNALADAKQDDINFLRYFVAQGCAECTATTTCYAFLGATSEGLACEANGDCASLRCCNDHGSDVCCNACRACSDASTSPSPHCTTLFDSLRMCLESHSATCVSECSGGGPDAFGDACFTCLAAVAPECNQLRFECQNEK